MEGIAFTYPNDKAFLPTNFAQYALNTTKFRYAAYQYYNLCCFFRVDSDDVRKRTYYPPESMKNEFGGYAVIVQQPKIFIQKVISYSNEQHWDCICGDVNYHSFGGNSINRRCITFCTSEPLPGIPVTDDSTEIHTYDCFDKHWKYRQQREWRICILRYEHTVNPCFLELGDLSSITNVVPAEKVNSELHKLYPDYHFSCLKAPEPTYHGNITRIDLHKKTISIDGRAYMLFDVG